MEHGKWEIEGTGTSSARKTLQWSVFSELGPAGPWEQEWLVSPKPSPTGEGFWVGTLARQIRFYLTEQIQILFQRIHQNGR